jgi:two-component system, OmpR family, osmolarity sensor histidine kinase EnvZ
VRLWPRTLFERTAVLIASTLLAFSVVAWQAIIWTAVVPAAELAVHVLTQRAEEAVAARRAGSPPPADSRFDSGEAPATPRFRRNFAFNAYVETIRSGLKTSLDSPDVRISRLAAPTEIWVRVRDVPDQWLVLSWRLVGPRAPLAAVGVLGAAALIVLIGAGLSARRLTAPLAGLAAAAARVAEGEKVDIETGYGPSEVRALAVAFQSMSHRLAELDEQRELMLAGISHDLRTPLARIRVALELVETQDPGLREEMAASVEEMDRMIGQILQYVRANYRESPSAAVLDDVVRRCLAPYSSDARVSLELNAPARIAFAVECVRHTVPNLVQNALEYGRTPVTVRTAIEPNGIVLRVEDSGDGLSGEQWSEALRPFHRLRAAPGNGHSGLGLALVERLVRMSGGNVDSQRAGGVFVVTVRLPLAEPVDRAART